MYIVSCRLVIKWFSHFGEWLGSIESDLEFGVVVLQNLRWKVPAWDVSWTSGYAKLGGRQQLRGEWGGGGILWLTSPTRARFWDCTLN